jgi:serine/threonine-protein kinase
MAEPQDVPEQTALPIAPFLPFFAGEVVPGARGSYRIGGQIGSGSFGTVWQCSDDWGTELAVKVLHPHHPRDELREMAIREASRAFALRHPNITYVFDAFEYKDNFHIVYERLEAPLGSLLTIENYDPAIWIQPVASSVLKALAFVHAENHVHQDIHMGNVLYGWQRHALGLEGGRTLVFKLADLGLCKLATQMDAKNTVLADWIKAPEAIDAGEFGPMDRRMDLYHAGLLLLQVAIGQEVRFTRQQTLDGEPRKLAEQLPAPYGPAIARSLRRHVLQRFADAKEFWLALSNRTPMTVASLLELAGAAGVAPES